MQKPSLDEIRERAERGDATAQYQLGNIYQQGLYEQPVDLGQALNWYQAAADQDHRDACFNVALITLRILPRQNQSPRADLGLPALEKAAKLGDTEALAFLGDVLITGEGSVPMDSERGARCLEQAGEAGETKAFRVLGAHLMNGDRLAADPRRANQLFKRAAEAGDPEAMFQLGVSLQTGRGVSPQPETARKLFRKAAEAGHGIAMVNVAVDLFEEDPDAATRWIMRSAEQGCAAGLYEAGQAYRLGRGVPADMQRAFQYYRAAAHQDHPDALFSLGLCYEHGGGTEINLAAAEQCYQHATMKGHGGAAHNLGIMYVQGKGVEMDRVLAKELFEYAIACEEDDAMFSMGLAFAQEEKHEDAWMWGVLSVLHRPQGQGQALLDHLAGQMDEAQRAAAAARADQWERPDKTMAFMVTGNKGRRPY
ncbi:MAG: hypothetical protein R3200_05895 [Xanthomonadales bacterium]|nr:hypothetical protein [Xanthomonadales bacterium]